MADDTDSYIKALQGLSPTDQAAMQPETFVNPLVKQKIDSLANTIAIPGQAYNSQTPMTTEDMLAPARDMTTTFGAIGVPMAQPGAAGIFGGKLAHTADLKALKEAEQMRLGGKHPADVMSDTGWFRPPTDQQWRFEIPDNKSSMNYMPPGNGDKASSSMSAFMQHPELYKAYPELASAPTSVVKNTAQRSGYFDNGKLFAEGPTEQDIRSILLHEAQHGVQTKEGFSPGADPAHYAQLIEKGLRANPNKFAAYDFDAVKKQADQLYHKTAGEVEARNVQNRLDYTPTERKLVMPWSSQDVHYADQLNFDPVANTLEALRRGK